MGWLVQGIGFVAAIAAISSFQIKKVKVFYLVQTLAGVLFCIQFFMLGAYPGVVMNVINVARHILLATEKKFVMTKTFLAIFTLLAVVAFFAFSGQASVPIAYTTLIATIVMGYSTWSRRPKLIRYIQLLILSPCWLTYDIYSGTWGGIITEIMVIMSTIIFLIRVRNLNLDTGVFADTVA